MDISTGTVTVQPITSNHPAVPEHPNSVQFEVKYPENYTGPRNTPEGICTISKEAAEVFAQRGIGKIVTPAADTTAPSATEEKAETAAETVKAEDAVDYTKLTVAELKALLTEKEIAFAQNAKKDELLVLLNDHGK